MEKTKKQKDVCVLGLGFVGLTLGLVLAESGVNVAGIDISDKIQDSLKKKKPPFHEEGLNALLKKYYGKGFTAQKTLPKDVSSIGTYIISVGTRITPSNNKPSFKELKSASISIGKKLKKDDLVILRSTVPLGTSREVVAPILEKHSGLKVGKDFSLAFAPERTIEGQALTELYVLPQIVGGYDKKSIKKCSDVFKLFVPEVVEVENLEAAELVKLMNNAYRDITFAFSNELIDTCGKYNLDLGDVIKAANQNYARSNIPKPSPGVGGYCLTKDPYILKYSADRVGSKLTLPQSARRIHENTVNYVHDDIFDYFKKNGKKGNKNILILGLAFKGNPPTSDIRFSPSLDVVDIFAPYKDVAVSVHDPLVKKEDFDVLGIRKVDDFEKEIEKVDVVITMIDHPTYKNMKIRKYIPKTKKSFLLYDPWSIHKKHLDFILRNNSHYANLGFRSDKLN